MKKARRITSEPFFGTGVAGEKDLGLGLAMERVAPQMRVVFLEFDFFLLQFLVLGREITGGGLAFGFRLRAL